MRLARGAADARRSRRSCQPADCGVTVTMSRPRRGGLDEEAHCRCAAHRASPRRRARADAGSPCRRTRSSARRPDPARPRRPASRDSRGRAAADQRAKVDRAVAGHGERAVDHRLEEAPVAVAREPDHVRPHVLAMHVADALDVLREHRDRIAAGERHVAAVEQQPDFVADAAPSAGRRRPAFRRTRPCDGGTRARTPCASVCRANAVRRSPYASHCVVARRSAAACTAAAARPGCCRRLRRRPSPWRRCRRAASRCGPTAAISSSTERRASRPEYQPDTSSRPCARQHRAQRLRLARKLVAELEALVADRLAFGQRRFERRLAAERRQVVVAPRDRIDADLHVERRSSSAFMACAAV